MQDIIKEYGPADDHRGCDRSNVDLGFDTDR